MTEVAPDGRRGRVLFGGVVTMLIGALHAVAGWAALFDSAHYRVTSDRLSIPADYGVWGWTHLAFGAVLIVVGLAVLVDRVWASRVLVVLAVTSALVTSAFLAAHPIWSAVVIGLDVVVIYALLARADR